MCNSTVLSSDLDPRPFIELKLFNTTLKGLLDSGASISLLGHECDKLLSNLGVKYKKLNSNVKTADGSRNKIIGYVDCPIEFNDRNKIIRFYLAPTLEGKMYLGVDFWREFSLAPEFVSELSLDPTCVDIDVHTLSLEDSQKLDNIKSLFPSFEKDGLGKTHLIEHVIDVGSNKPIKQRFYPVSPAIQDLMYAELDRMLELGVIEESMSSWNSPVVLVRKPGGKIRLCLDSRKLNSITVKDAYPLPHIDGLLGRLKDTHFITSIDLKDAFWQVPLEESSRDKTAFTVPGRPLYQFRVMPFGLCNSPQTMCRLMHKTIPHIFQDQIFVYLDDLLIISATLSEHFELLTLVAKLLKNAGLTINVQKSKFVMKKLRYLGYIVGEGGLRTDPEKIQAISDFPRPSTIKQIRRFLGMAGWYQRFIINYADLTAPITDLLKKKNKFLWTPEAELAFKKLKEALSTAPVLVNPDYTKDFFIRCDASLTGIGGVLYQISNEGHEQPIAFVSKKLNEAQKKYSVSELECLSAIISVKKFRPYIEGYRFHIITDHSSLKWLMSQKDLNGRLARWSLKLQMYDFTISHQKGSENIVPDTLSRAYCDSVDLIVTSVNLLKPKLDLKSPHFQNTEYLELLHKIKTSPENYDAFKLYDDRIYIKIDPTPNEDLCDLPAYKLWIPSPLTQFLINKEHNSAVHSGIKKTLESLRRFYYWPNMKNEVYTFIKNCDTCKETKHTNQITRPRLGEKVVADRPFQKLYIDLMGPYPRSSNNNKFILVIVDQLTKFVFLKALSSSTTPKIISYLTDEVFMLFGVPEFIHTDNGPQFISKMFQDLLSDFKITHIRTAYYSPQANLSERVNRSILAGIRTYVNGNHKNWDKHLSKIACSLRNTVHQTTKFSPYFLLFGYHMITEGNHYELLRSFKVLDDADLKILPLSDRLSILHKEVQSNIKEAFEKYSKYYNLRSTVVSYQPNEIVFIKQHHLSDAKNNFCYKFAPIYNKAIIKKRIGLVNYACEDCNGRYLGVYHAKDIKKA